jgi:hypothetical protein
MKLIFKKISLHSRLRLRLGLRLRSDTRAEKHAPFAQPRNHAWTPIKTYPPTNGEVINLPSKKW